MTESGTDVPGQQDDEDRPDEQETEQSTPEVETEDEPDNKPGPDMPRVNR
jgi:hypothetical protein